jgi:hypothetical protein
MNIKNISAVLELIESKLKPDVKKKKEKGEVFTPMELVSEMLDTLPKEVWSNKDLKWLEPSAGMGNFLVAVFIRLMEGLKNIIEDEEERRKHILENMLHMVELDEGNVLLLKEIFCDDEYNLNIYQGSFIDYKHFKKINIDMKFDIILGNPPFQYKEENKQAHAIWQLFIKRSYDELLHHKGYLLFIHPSGWRDISGIYRYILNYIKEHNLIYLSINSFKKGQKIFGISSNFDYYLVQNIKTNTNITRIKDIDDDIYDKNLNDWDFIPSGKLNIIEKLLAKNEKVEIIYSSIIYDIRRAHMNELKADNYKYPCVYTISQRDGTRFWYSNENKGHFGIPKVIWSNGAGNPIIDEKGEYGLTEFAYAIVDDKENLELIKNAMLNDDFINLMKYLVFKENHKYNYKIIALFKKDFYKDFI